MARDDYFRRSFEAGTAFLGMSRERAEALVKDLVKAGEVQKGKAQKVIDDLLERSRKGTEELRQLIGREISEQVGALGLATKDDVARLEARIDELAATGAGAAATAGPVTPPEPTKAAPVKKAGAPKAAPAKSGSKAAPKAEPAGEASAPAAAAAPPVEE